ncbi:DUF3551 domain-containing protein [Bradyrhizobium liaoningense]|uniref:DUF3551 domain-containing protein n=1 Tax=Bradyrhizobium liaoningense TaxID=43992 RepID=UPI001BAE0C58|nr:DUF3551 domain-containing protein [Bradyrhizobium liaoningense]MBR0716882.1 DUF3551 domain-containing protein [Bradyrhizobium liaoningense]
MRTILMAGLILLGAASSANAYDYPWCVFGEQLGASGDCMYSTREQCLASASGRWNTYCDINPRVRFRQQAAPPAKSRQQAR